MTPGSYDWNKRHTIAEIKELLLICAAGLLNEDQLACALDDILQLISLSHLEETHRSLKARVELARLKAQNSPAPPAQD